MTTYPKISDGGYGTVDVFDGTIATLSQLLGAMLDQGGLPDRYKGDLYHDVVRLQEYWRRAEQRYREDSPICLQFYWGVRDYGTQMADSFRDAIGYPMDVGMRFYSAYRITLYKGPMRSGQSFRLLIERLDIPTIERQPT